LLILIVEFIFCECNEFISLEDGLGGLLDIGYWTFLSLAGAGYWSLVTGFWLLDLSDEMK